MSTRFTQCQTVIRNNLQKSSNNHLVRIYYDTNCDSNLRYDLFKSHLKRYYPISKKQRKLNNNCLNNAKPRNKINMGAWNEISSWNLVPINFKAAKKYYKFSIRYVNNSLANASNLHKWGKTTSSLCLHCNKNQTLGHVVAGCETSLREKRYNYRHDSILWT